MPKRKKRNPEFVVLSRENAERYEPREREICISIADPDADPAELSRGFAAVLRLSFTDIIERGDPSDVLFSEDHAQAIREFIDAWPDATRIVVHCHAGMSRSPGVALGLCDIRGWATAELERAHPGWNRLVRRSLAAKSQDQSNRGGRASAR
jgi:predicted protein tyrosine phosphatase